MCVVVFREYLRWYVGECVILVVVWQKHAELRWSVEVVELLVYRRRLSVCVCVCLCVACVFVCVLLLDWLLHSCALV